MCVCVYVKTFSQITFLLFVGHLLAKRKSKKLNPKVPREFRVIFVSFCLFLCFFVFFCAVVCKNKIRVTTCKSVDAVTVIYLRSFARINCNLSKHITQNYHFLSRYYLFWAPFWQPAHLNWCSVFYLDKMHINFIESFPFLFDVL